jgi:hypothetical protein
MQATCQHCQTTYDLDITDEQVNRWRSGELIQRAMPNLSADERELLIGGLCGRCFDGLFPDDDEDDSEEFLRL